MPIYEYRCRECGDEFELLVRRDETGVKCPECDSSDIVRKFSAFAVKSSSSSADRSAGAYAGGSCSGCSGGHCSTCH